MGGVAFSREDRLPLETEPMFDEAGELFIDGELYTPVVKEGMKVEHAGWADFGHTRAGADRRVPQRPLIATCGNTTACSGHHCERGDMSMAPPSQTPSVDRLDERSKAHADKLDALEERCAKMEIKLDSIIKTLDEARGGWRMLILIAGIAGTAGALIAKASTWLPAVFR